MTSGDAYAAVSDGYAAVSAGKACRSRWRQLPIGSIPAAAQAPWPSTL